MRVIFVRHADPDYEKDSLTEKGWREAELLSRRLMKMDIKAFYCSSLGRAKDTASLTLKKLGREAEIHDFMKEFHHPVVDPRNGEQLHIPWDFMPAHWTEEPDFTYVDTWMDKEIMRSGSIAEYYKEVCDGLDAILAKHGYVRYRNRYRTTASNRDTIVIFCHFGSMCAMLAHMLHISPVCLWQGLCAAPSSVTTVYTEEREEGEVGFRCASYGDISHLYVADEEPAFAARFCETYDNMDERH